MPNEAFVKAYILGIHLIVSASIELPIVYMNFKYLQ